MMDLEAALYVVSLPIGNRDDITLRALAVLGGCDVLAAEDTRKATQLLGHYDIDPANKKMLSMHDHNESQRIPEILRYLNEGCSVALISDAGTPLISDPGYSLVNAIVTAGFTVRSIPGASALVTALTVSGLPTDRFLFVGFLPAKQHAKREVLLAISKMACTIVVYESPKRIMSTLHMIADELSPQREVVVARELTKVWETVYSGEVRQVIDDVRDDPHGEKGECVLLIKGLVSDGETSLEADVVIRRLANELPPKTVAKITADLCGGNKQDHYRRLLSIKQTD